ncbi:type II thyroxine 5'-deiodinase [Sarotherodon galilaeus]
MAQRGLQLDHEKFCCPVCLDLLEDPATLPCGHSYCMCCIKKHWDEESRGGIPTCPQCRQIFIPKPVLGKNTMLADLVEELKKTGLQAAPHPQHYAGPGDVACDVCSGRKLKASRSCLQCVASYCELHLRPHYEAPIFHKHQLVEASAELQEIICSVHSKVKEVFCRSDQQCICLLCAMDEHRGHDTVSAAAERTERQGELGPMRLDIQLRIQDAQRDVELLQQQVEAIDCSADEALKDSRTRLSQLLRLVEEKSCEVQQQIRSQQQTEVSRVKELEKKLQQEISELRRRDVELEQLSRTEEHSQFLLRYSSLSALSEPTRSASISVHPPCCFLEVTAAVSELTDKLQSLLSQDHTQISAGLAWHGTIAELLRDSRLLSVDPNTVSVGLKITEGNRKLRFVGRKQSYPHHPHRFTDSFQALSTQSLTVCSYWEVKWSGAVSVAVAYGSVSRTGSDSSFGDDHKSWALYCDRNGYKARHDGASVVLSGPPSSVVGVHLDHSAGVLSFYSVCDTVTLLHRVRTTFTEPLHAGLCVCLGSTAELLRPS